MNNRDKMTIIFQRMAQIKGKMAGDATGEVHQQPDKVNTVLCLAAAIRINTNLIIKENVDAKN
jgi:hypothetical protein